MSSDNPEKIYYHPEALQKLYLPQVDSIDIVNFTVSRGLPVFITTLQETDLQNDLAQRRGLGEISRKELEGIRLQIHKDKTRGKLLPLESDWTAVHDLAREFTHVALYAHSWHTLDLFHLATARHLEFDGFLTPDRNLRELANQLGFITG